MTKIFTFYNNKGGVAKTTSVFNVAVYLASRKGKKVLIVDCDSQCNCTELFFCSDSDFGNPEKSLSGTSILEALRPRFEGSAAKINVDNIELSTSSIYTNLHILRGDINFSSAEQYFSAAIAQAVTDSIHDKNTYAVMARMLRDLGAKHGFDYILCDVGPSSGSITRMVLLSCDGFFIPTSPDRFSYQAIQGVKAVMQEWFSRHNLIVKTFANYGLDVPFREPKFCGAIINNYKIYKVQKAKVAFQTWTDLIKTAIIELLKNGSSDWFGTNLPKLKTDPFVALIRDVGALAPTAQLVGKAIFDITQEDTALASSDGQTYKGAVWASWEHRKTEYMDEVSKISQVIEDL